MFWRKKKKKISFRDALIAIQFQAVSAREETMDVKIVQGLIVSILHLSAATGALFPAKVNPIFKQASEGKIDRELTDRRAQIGARTSDWLAETAALDVMSVTLWSHPIVVGPSEMFESQQMSSLPIMAAINWAIDASEHGLLLGSLHTERSLDLITATIAVVNHQRGEAMTLEEHLSLVARIVAQYEKEHGLLS